MAETKSRKTEKQNQGQRYISILQRDEKPLSLKELRVSTLHFLTKSLTDESEKYFIRGREVEGKILVHAAAIVERDLGRLLEHEGLPQVACNNYVSSGGGFYLAGEGASAMEMYQEAKRLGANTDQLIKQNSRKLEIQSV